MKWQDDIVKAQDFSLSDPYDEDGGEQIASINSQVSWRITKDIDGIDNKNGVYIYLGSIGDSQEASYVTASKSGEMMLNTTWSQYWYVFDTTVDITIDDKSKGKVTLFKDSPLTTAESTTISSSISFGAGCFGDIPTANASYGTSTSETLPDFALQNMSSHPEGILSHKYYAASLEGDPVHNVTDTPKAAPVQAYSNIPIISQGLWVADSSYKGVTTFTITLNINLVAAHMNALKWSTQYSDYSVTQTFTINWDDIEENVSSDEE